MQQVRKWFEEDGQGAVEEAVAAHAVITDLARRIKIAAEAGKITDEAAKTNLKNKAAELDSNYFVYTDELSSIFDLNSPKICDGEKCYDLHKEKVRAVTARKSSKLSA